MSFNFYRLLNALRAPFNRRREHREKHNHNWRFQTMLIKSMQVGFIGTNCYILTDETTMKTAVIDPGGDSNMILNYLEQNHMDCVAILLTHGHMDHTMGVDNLQKETGAPVYIHKKDCGAPGTRSMGYPYIPTGEYRFYDEGDTVPVGSLTVQVLYTPGHTPGGVTLLCENAMFPGDTLFKDSCGRVDLDGGNATEELASLKRLAELPGDYEVYPGHMDTTTLAQERIYNPYVRAALSGVTEF